MRLKKPLIAAAVVSGAFGLGFGGAAIASAATAPAHANTPNVAVAKATNALESSGSTGSSSSSSNNSSSTTTHRCPNMGTSSGSTSG